MAQLNYQEALDKARKVKSRINRFTEYNNAFAFWFDSGDETMGGDEPVVIMKDTGEAINFISYAVTPGKKVIRDGNVE